MAPESQERVAACHHAVADLIATGRPIYAVNTGFGKLAAVRINPEHLGELQRNLILSHCAGCPCRKSNPDIFVMQPAQNWVTKNVTDGPNGARDRRILL